MSLLRIIFYGVLVAALFGVAGAAQDSINEIMVSAFNFLHDTAATLKGFDGLFPFTLLLTRLVQLATIWAVSVVAALLLGAGKFVAAPNTNDAG